MDARVDLSKSPIPEVLAALSTDPLKGLDAKTAADRLAHFGPNALEEKKTSEWVLFFRYFWGPIPWMIEAAAIMALVVRDWGDFTIILALLVFNAVLGFFEEHQASNALQALKNALALKAEALRDGVWSEIDATDIVPGDIVRVRLGDVVPADARIVSGDYLSVDQAALTGESLPVSKKPGDILYSGSIAKQGEIQAVVTETGARTFFGRTASLVQSAGATSHFQAAVMRIGDFLIAAAGVLAVILVAVQLSRGADVLRLAEFVLILLVASVPVAMPAVLSVTMALGAKLLAREKAIVSRLESIEEMAGMDILCSDKTGTLTQNKLTLGEVSPWKGADPKEALLVASLASKAEDRDPIDLAVLAGLHDDASLKAYTQSAYQPFDPVTKRTEATAKGPDGATFKAAKGAPQVIMALAKLEGADLDAANKAVDAYAAKGFRTLGVARTDASGAWRFLGFIPLYDPPRADSKETIARAEAYGVRVKMVTGDDVAIAQQIAGDLGLGTRIQPATQLFEGGVAKGDIPADIAERIEAADGFARVFPEHKYAIVKALQEQGHIVGMTGDGVNDAPALKQADIGVAVSGATDAARAAAALILTAPGLSTIIRGIEEARRIFERMMSYTLYRIAMTLDIMVFIVLATIVYGFFPLTPVMIIMLALLDDIPIMAIAFDRAKVPSRPVRWRMDRVLVVSSVLGALAVLQSFGLLVLGQNVLHLDAPHLQTILFLQLVVGGHLMLFVTRAKGPFWAPPFPGTALFWAIVATQIVAALLCAYGVLVPALPWALIGLVWAYNLVWMFVQDLAKLAIYHELDARVTKATPFLARLTEPLGATARRPAAVSPAAPAPSRRAADHVATVLGLAAVAALLWAAHMATQNAASPVANEAPAASAPAAPAADPAEDTAPPAPAPSAAPPAPAKTSAQLGVLPTEARAKSRWRQLQKRAPGVIGAHQPTILRKEKDGQTAWFVEIADFKDRLEAAAFCEALRARGAECALVGE
ncbi:plasma-membrane proton-efflux P-type ATPase [Methylocystis echinoides]|uniref:plasma-membrane proton-efflux P-type ATPase n=1 Tax=Methylocystis echinoides TaxID=29468 RepID=UPI00343A3B30